MLSKHIYILSIYSIQFPLFALMHCKTAVSNVSVSTHDNKVSLLKNFMSTCCT